METPKPIPHSFSSSWGARNIMHGAAFYKLSLGFSRQTNQRIKAVLSYVALILFVIALIFIL